MCVFFQLPAPERERLCKRENAPAPLFFFALACLYKCGSSCYTGEERYRQGSVRRLVLRGQRAKRA